MTTDCEITTKARRSPFIIITTKITAHDLKSPMLANGIKTFNVSQNNNSMKLFTKNEQEHHQCDGIDQHRVPQIQSKRGSYRWYFIYGLDTQHPDEELQTRQWVCTGTPPKQNHVLLDQDKDGPISAMNKSHLDHTRCQGLQARAYTRNRAENFKN